MSSILQLFLRKTFSYPTAAAAALKAAEDALANLDANIAQLKKEIGWVEADLAPLKAAWDAAVVAVEEAKAALEAAGAEVEIK